MSDDQIPLKPPKRPPSPEAKEPNDGQQNTRSAESRRRRELPDSEALMEQLLQVNGLMLMRLISPQMASTIGRNIQVVLTAQMKRASGGNVAASADVMDRLRENPALLNHFSGLLSDEEIAELAREFGEDEP